MKFSFSVAVCFTINYIIGTGFLTLPYGFYQTGPFLGTLTLILMTVISIFSVVFILESMARAEKLTKRYGYARSGKFSLQNYHAIELNSRDSHYTSIEGSEEGLTESIAQVEKTKFEFTELCEIYLGSFGERIYTCVISIYIYSSLWAYSTVFAHAFASHFNIGTYSYHIYLFLFALCVVPASMVELSEQVHVQVFLSLCRILMVILMVISVAFAKITDTPDSHSFSDIPPSESSAQLTNDMSKLYILLPIAAYANIFHHSIPALSDPVQDKSSLSQIFSSALLICAIAYISIGLVLSLFFRDQTRVASNLNWATYTGHVDPTTGQLPFSAHFISFFVVVFPALDVASAFPLNAITLGNNLFSAFYGALETHEVGANPRALSRFRAFAAIPPIIAAFLVSDLGNITAFAGVSGFAVAFIFPALLGLYSEKKCRQMGFEPRTVYSLPWLGYSAQIITLLIGVGLVIFVVSSLVFIGPPPSR